jgi:hypothetical protein
MLSFLHYRGQFVIDAVFDRIFFRLVDFQGQIVFVSVLDVYFLIRYLIHLLSPSFSSKPLS